MNFAASASPKSAPAVTSRRDARPRSQPLSELSPEPALADPRLTEHHEGHRDLVLLGRVEAREQRGELAAATHERGGPPEQQPRSFTRR